MADYCEVDIQKIRDSDLPAIIKMEVENFISWDFNLGILMILARPLAFYLIC